MFPLKSLPQTSNQSGFTLLELVLVMFIIALVASTPLLFIDEQDQQLRYEETKEKIRLIKNALLHQKTYRDMPLYSGFIIDNGVLPSASTADLLSDSDNWSKNWLTNNVIHPYFEITSKSGQLSLFSIRKGHFGPYINNYIDSDGVIKDSWGNEFNLVVGNSEGGSTASLAIMASPPSTSAYPEITTSIDAREWQITLADLNINILSANTSEASSHVVALLVFRNQTASAESDNWSTYHFTADIPAAVTDVSGGLLSLGRFSSKSAVWYRDGEESTPLTASTTYIPAGEHLLIVDPDASLAPSSASYDYIKVIPGASQPTITLKVN